MAVNKVTSTSFQLAAVMSIGCAEPNGIMRAAVRLENILNQPNIFYFNFDYPDGVTPLQPYAEGSRSIREALSVWNNADFSDVIVLDPYASITFLLPVVVSQTVQVGTTLDFGVTATTGPTTMSVSATGLVVADDPLKDFRHMANQKTQLEGLLHGGLPAANVVYDFLARGYSLIDVLEWFLEENPGREPREYLG